MPTREGWLDPAIVLGVGSRRVVGWSTMLFQSDRGSQDASDDLRATANRHKIELMSGKGDYWDNAVVQIGMLIGFATSYPMNWWLIRRGIREDM